MKSSIRKLFPFILMSGISGNTTLIAGENIVIKSKVIPKPKNLKYWPEYDVWAINKRNAIRKSKNKVL